MWSYLNRLINMLSQCNFHSLLLKIMQAIAILAMAYPSNAQSIPGRWHKVALPQPGVVGNDNTIDFSFIDSLNGICVLDDNGSGYIGSTTNGGRSWFLDTNLNTNIGAKFNLNSVVCFRTTPWILSKHWSNSINRTGWHGLFEPFAKYKRGKLRGVCNTC